MQAIGADIAEIARFEPLIQKERFLEKHFTDAERAYFEKKHFAAQTIAATFAAKEAFSKAIGTGLSGFSLSEVEVLHAENGTPRLQLHGQAAKAARDAGFTEFSVSLSHDGGMAFAVVLAWS